MGVVFLLLLLLGHLPAHFMDIPEIKPNLGNTVEILALSGGALVIAHLNKTTSAKRSTLDKYTALGSHFFAIMLILFGTAHLISTAGVSSMVPKYIPFPVFWTYLSGVALVGSGLCFLFKYKLKIVALLLSGMLFLWLLMLHLYYAIRFPQFQDGENIIGSFQCLAFCGVALLVSQLPTRKDRALKVSELAH